jgi:two-component system, OmpR family, alkaline phosphatase synthesis response regulator PhoP
MDKPTILVVDDEASIRTVVRSYLEGEGYTVLVCKNGRTAFKLIEQYRPTLLILDLMLPEMDGLEIAAQLRQSSDPALRDIYILMLTARSEETDRIAGLRLGADDYLTKPFSPRELVARVQAILRRSRQAPGDNRLRFTHLTIDPDSHEAKTADDALLDLTATEFSVLLELARHAGRVLSREQLLDRVWGIDYYGTERVVDVYVGQVRRKLEEATGEPLIQTVRGVGYKFVSPKVSADAT